MWHTGPQAESFFILQLFCISFICLFPYSVVTRNKVLGLGKEASVVFFMKRTKCDQYHLSLRFRSLFSLRKEERKKKKNVFVYIYIYIYIYICMCAGS